MTPTRAALVLGASVVLGCSLPWRALGAGASPDLPLVAVLVVATRLRGPEALALAALAGLLEDALTTTPLGVHAMALAIVAYLTGWLSERVLLEALPLKALLLCVGPWVAEALVRTVLHLLTRVPFELPGEGILGRCLATLLLGILAWRAPRPEAATHRL